MAKQLFILLILPIISYLMVKGITGDSTFALEVASVIVAFGFVLILPGIFSSIREKRKYRKEEKLDPLVRSGAEVPALQIDNAKEELGTFLSERIREPLEEMRRLSSQLSESVYGKLPPAAEEAAREIYDRSIDIEGAVREKITESLTNVQKKEHSSIQRLTVRSFTESKQ